MAIDVHAIRSITVPLDQRDDVRGPALKPAEPWGRAPDGVDRPPTGRDPFAAATRPTDVNEPQVVKETGGVVKILPNVLPGTAPAPEPYDPTNPNPFPRNPPAPTPIRGPKF